MLGRLLMKRVGRRRGHPEALAFMVRVEVTARGEDVGASSTMIMAADDPSGMEQMLKVLVI